MNIELTDLIPGITGLFAAGGGLGLVALRLIKKVKWEVPSRWLARTVLLPILKVAKSESVVSTLHHCVKAMIDEIDKGMPK